MTIGFKQQDYARQLLALMPRGRAWPKFDEAVQAQVALGLCGIYETSDLAAVDLLAEIFPSTTEQLLPEWEATLGLPDLCAGEDQSIAQRRGQVVARFTNAGGQSVATLVAYAGALGFTITIGEDAPFRMGESSMGDHLGADEWIFVWTVQAPLTTVSYFLMGEGAMGDPLEDFGNTLLECEMGNLGPVHTVENFAYGFDLHTGFGADFINDVHWTRPIDSGAPTVDDFSTLFPFTRSTTATYRNAAGVLATAPINSPRIAYDNAGALLGLQLEASRTNLLVRSEDFATSWAPNSSSVVANSTAAPDGNVTADTIVEGVGGTFHYTSQGITVVSGTRYTASVFVKAKERGFAQVQFAGADFANQAAQINLATGAVTGVNGPLAVGSEQYANGWWRVWVSATPTGTAGGILVLMSGSAVFSYAGDGVSGIYAWGAQIEAGFRPTSYIATAGATVTRGQDRCSRLIGSEVAPGLGSFSIDCTIDQADPAGGGNEMLLRFSDATYNNQVVLNDGSTGTLGLSVAAGGVFNGANASPNLVNATPMKAAAAWANNDAAVCLNAGTVAIDLTCPIPSGLTRFDIGSDHLGFNNVQQCFIRRFDYYPSRKSNAELQALST